MVSPVDAGFLLPSRGWVSRMHITRMVLALSILQAVGLYWFCGGFLLARVGVNMVSTTNTPINAEGEQQNRPFEKAIVIVVDALRLDFLCAQPYSESGATHVEAMNETLALLDTLVRPLTRCPPAAPWRAPVPVGIGHQSEPPTSHDGAHSFPSASHARRRA